VEDIILSEVYVEEASRGVFEESRAAAGESKQMSSNHFGGLSR
jgi:hypothetical protein